MSRTRGIRKANATDVVFDAGLEGDAYPRIEIRAGGTIWTGDGTVPPNVQMDAAPSAPGTPGTPTATVASSTSVSLVWTAAAPNGSAVTNYVITPYIGTTAQATTTIGNVLTGTVTGLTTGTAYSFKVHAVNGVGAGGQSAASDAVTPASVPGAPTIGTATAGNAQASVTFTAPGSNGGSVITSYTATASTGQTASGSSSPIVITGLANGTVVTITVHATNAVGNSAESAASNSVTPSGPFSPSGIADLKWWGEDLPLANDASVTSWTDLSSASHPLVHTFGAAPVNKTGILDGLSVVRYSAYGNLSAAFTMDQPWTVVLVAKLNSSASSTIFDSATSGAGLLRGTAGNWRAFGGGGGGIGPIVGPAVDTSWHVFAVTFNGTSSVLRVDGGAGTTGNIGTATSGGFTLGAWAGVEGLDGDVYGGVVVGHAMTPAELNQIGPYFVAKAPTTLPAWTTVP